MCPYPIRTCRSDSVRFRTENCTNLYDRFWIVQKDRTLNPLIQKELRDFMYDRTFCTVKNRKVKGENKYVLCVKMIKNYARVGGKMIVQNVQIVQNPYLSTLACCTN